MLHLLLLLAVLISSYYACTTIVLLMSNQSGISIPFIGDFVERSEIENIGAPIGSIWQGNAMVGTNQDANLLFGDADLSAFTGGAALLGDIDYDIDDMQNDLQGSPYGIDTWDMQGASKSSKGKISGKKKTALQKLAKTKENSDSNSNKSSGVIKTPKDLLADKVATNIIKSGNNDDSKANALQTLTVKNMIPGLIAASVSWRRIMAWGAKQTIHFTDLLISGTNMTESINLWQTWNPGLSHNQTATSVANTPLVFTFGAPLTGQLSKIIPMIITMITNELNSIKGGQITVTVTGEDQNSNPFSMSGDAFAVFTENNQSRLLVFPTVKIKEMLFITPLQPTLLTPVVITVTGLPAGVNVNVKLPGLDSEEWLDYKKMINIS